jgi:Holliday junction resolvase RusA-like endonuclease
MMIEFFLPMKKPPTITSQEKGIDGRGESPRVYTKDEVKQVKLLFTALLSKYSPKEPLTGAVRLVTKWLYPTRTYKDGSYKTTRPDTDNVVKLFKDCMTSVGFWKDDAQVASEVTEKLWVNGSPSGIYVRIEELP